MGIHFQHDPYQTSASIPLQTMKVQMKVDTARIDSTCNQDPAKERVVSAIKLVITLPHLSMHIHLSEGQVQN